MKKTYKLGRLNFSLLGKSIVSPYIEEELSSISSSNSIDSTLELEWVSELSEIDGATVLPPYRIGADCLEAKGGGFEYQLRRANDGLKAEIKCTGFNGGSKIGRLQPAFLRKFRNWNYLNREQEVAKNFMYNFFDYAIQCSQVSLGQTFLHASSIERDGRGVVIAGWGGVGKTTSVLKLVTEHGWNFLSDDLGLIDESGKVFRHPKKMQIYAYNLLGQPVLKQALLSGRTTMDRWSWNFKKRTKGIKGVRRRVSAEELFGKECVGDAAQINDVFLIERADCNQIEVNEISLEEAVSRCTATLVYELNPYFRVVCTSRTAGLTNLFPTIEEQEKQSGSIIASAFSSSVPKLMRIPLRMGPNELADKLIQELAK